MIRHPLLLLSAFIALVALLRKFRAWPLPFWCYIVPMGATTLGLIPADSSLYGLLSQQLLPVCIVLLLIGTDLKGIVRLGPLAIGLMLIGSFGTIAGGLASYWLYHRWLPAMSWAGIGALSASWIGGSANLLAVKEALHVPDGLIGPLVIVDAVVAYSWMALLIWASCLQNPWDRLIRRKATQGLGSAKDMAWGAGFEGNRRPERAGCPKDERGPTLSAVDHAGVNKGLKNPAPEPWLASVLLTPSPVAGLVTVVGFSIVLCALAQAAARRLPTFGETLSATTWTILLVTTAALVLSLTPLKQLEEVGASRLGTFALYVLLASIGARANFRAITDAPVFAALGVTWIALHGIILLVGGMLLKAPLGLLATASQANIGGPISAPIVGATYSARLSSIGLLMAILGNILGTYLGLVTAWLARAVWP